MGVHWAASWLGAGRPGFLANASNTTGRFMATAADNRDGAQFSGFFNGCGKTKFVMAEGILGAFGVRIPIAYLMSRRVPVSLFLIGLATPCSTVLEDVLCVVYFLWLRKRLRQPLAD